MTFLATLSLGRGEDAPETSQKGERWGTTFRETYRSRADDQAISFEVRLPPVSTVADGQKLPLMVVLKGGLRVAPSEAFPLIQIKPSRGRTWAYRAMSAYDALQAIAHMKRNYPVDVDRVYLVGASAGGSGAMQLASGHADEFAAVLPLVAAGTGYPLMNFKHLPVAFHHGDRDWTSSICNARVQALRMQALGCPTILVEYPGAGHSIPPPHEPLVEWLFEQRRDPSPLSIAHECESLSGGRSHWLAISEFRDPHQKASVEAEVEFSGDRGSLRIEARNVAAFSLDTDRMPQGVVAVEVNGDPLSLDPSAEPEPVELRYGDGYWEEGPLEVRSGDGSWRPYQAGAAANLYQGEPLLIVYGTGNGRGDRLRAAAEKLAACGGPPFGAMARKFPIVADVDLTPKQEAQCNLILVGAPADHRFTAALLPDLPISIREGALVAGGREAMPLEDRVLSLLYPNPRHGQRLVYLLAPMTDDEGLEQFARAPAHFLVGGDGFNRISQADLCVQTLDHRIGRLMQFDKEWQWLAQPGADRPMPARFGGIDRSNLTRVFLEIMRQESGADFGLWWGAKDKGMWGVDFNFLPRYDTDGGAFTEADFRTRRHSDDTAIGGVSGAELRVIWTRWGEKGELLFVPEIQLDSVDDQRMYRLHIPADLYIKLGQRKKNLADPQPGPAISSEQVMEMLFRQGE